MDGELIASLVTALARLIAAGNDVTHGQLQVLFEALGIEGEHLVVRDVSWCVAQLQRVRSDPKSAPVLVEAFVLRRLPRGAAVALVESAVQRARIPNAASEAAPIEPTSPSGSEAGSTASGFCVPDVKQAPTTKRGDGLPDERQPDRLERRMYELLERRRGTWAAKTRIPDNSLADAGRNWRYRRRRMLAPCPLCGGNEGIEARKSFWECRNCGHGPVAIDAPVAAPDVKKRQPWS